MYSRGGLIVAALLAYTFFTLLEMSEGRPHIRHHRGGTHCSRCAPGWGVMSPCTRGRDSQCGECLPGTYSPHHSTQPCWICSRCGPGLYEAHPCTSTTDTVCDSCHRPAPDNADYRAKCTSGENFFLAPEDASNTGEESILVNEPHSLDAEEEQLLEKDAAASAAALERNRSTASTESR